MIITTVTALTSICGTFVADEHIAVRAQLSAFIVTAMSTYLTRCRLNVRAGTIVECGTMRWPGVAEAHDRRRL
jgi:hypothetical protein